MTPQRVKSKLETVEMKQKLSTMPRLPLPTSTIKPVPKTNFPLFDSRMTFLSLSCIFSSKVAHPTLERLFEDPIQIATDGLYLLLVWPSVSGRDVFVSVVGEYLRFQVTLSALRYSQYLYFDFLLLFYYLFYFILFIIFTSYFIILFHYFFVFFCCGEFWD